MKRKANEINEQSTWQELTMGCEIYEAGTSRLTKTGEWRSQIPIWDADKCRHCMMCTPFCPDSSIPVTEGKRGDFDYDYCKGCGICYTVCPFGAIDWKEVQ